MHGPENSADAGICRDANCAEKRIERTNRESRARARRPLDWAAPDLRTNIHARADVQRHSEGAAPCEAIRICENCGVLRGARRRHETAGDAEDERDERRLQHKRKTSRRKCARHG